MTTSAMNVSTAAHERATMTDVLKVCYPLGGHTFLLHWYTYSDRGHVIMSRTEKGLRAASERVFTENPNAEIKDVFEINVVGPSKKLIKLAERAVADEAVRDFYEAINYRLLEAVKAGRELPAQAPFELCSSYEPDEEGEQSDWAMETHYGCKHCKSGIKLVGATPSTLYEKYYGPWAVKHPYPARYYERGYVSSRAEPWDDESILWYASADFGHHAKGVTLNEVNLDEADGYKPGYFSDRVMFFFVHVRAVDTEPFEKSLAEKAALAKKECAARKEERRREFEQNKQKDNDEILALFTDQT
jgi:hypothetical protein